jgi:hypothetical protein
MAQCLKIGGGGGVTFFIPVQHDTVVTSFLIQTFDFLLLQLCA